MEYEDRVSISTPEGVQIELTLAGLGSRLAAFLIDISIILVLMLIETVVVGLLLTAISGNSGLGFGAAGGLSFFILVGFGAYFEANREGQTPGKQRLDIKVVSADGGPVDLRSAVVRNLMVMIDGLISFGLVAAVAITRTERSQRLGDIAAGTLVVISSDDAAPAADMTVSLDALPVLERAGSWDLRAIGEGETHVVRQFLSRRGVIDRKRRAELASRLAARLRPKIVGLEPGLTDEGLLEIVAALKAQS